MKHECCECSESTFAEFNDIGYYHFQCPNGHEYRCILYQQYFELLFDLGLHAIHDGYYREAVTSFHSSLERTYETFLKVYLYEKNTKEYVVNKMFKHVYLSERKYGAFVSAYVASFNRVPKALPVKLVKFRNDVVHNGSVPTREQAMAFGQSVMSVQRPIINRMKYRLKEGARILIEKHVLKALNASEGRSDLARVYGITAAPSFTLEAPYKRKFRIDDVMKELEDGPWGLES